MSKIKLVLMISLLLSLTLPQFVFASDKTLKVEVSNHNEGTVPSPVVVDGTNMFPIGKILNILDRSGTETVVRDKPSVHSYVTFQGNCYSITEGKKEVTGYVVDESGVCFEPTGKVYQLEKAAVYPSDKEGVYVPLSFIEKDIVGSENDTIYLKDKNTLVFNMYTWDEQEEKMSIILKIGDPWMYISNADKKDETKQIDPEEGSTPVIRDDRTLLPIANIVKEFGGIVTWDGNEKKVSITLNRNNVDLWIDKNRAVVNGAVKTLDVAPTIISNKTMVPLKFVSDNLGLKLVWDGKNQVIALYKGMFDNVPSDYSEYFAYKNDEKTKQNTKNDKTTGNDKPLDINGNLLKVGDVVQINNMFAGEILEIQGSKILIYWNQRSALTGDKKISEEKMKFTAMFLAGIKWHEYQWGDAKTVSIVGVSESAFYY
ncbi:hypothetical protein BC351_17545 [Paenibacillus ferrarius]|uniref:Copper amine oxidase-like N-terminal domain-containing protein n=1 Tax=Paenibacillus ferrarius TaxID=1469647 RepID=A0A1V4HPX5_9BACL|nr:stalk domain-containing protein [Paenibacillus ferrarius]OPH60302.1 hypothetical protein BC351_17545 [Paenibacillus ferrarius]